MARYWVGGATGFLGSHLTKLLVARGHEVVGVSRSGGNVGSIAVQAVDVLDSKAVASSASGCDGAFLATGMVSRDKNDAEVLHRANVLGVRHALSGLSAAGVERTVVASTSGTIAVGTDPAKIFDEQDDPPLELIASWPYYRSKLFGEYEALEANREGFDVVVVNPSLLLGPGDLRESSTGDVRRFLDRSIPAVPRGGIAFVDARDAALGMLLAPGTVDGHQGTVLAPSETPRTGVAAQPRFQQGCPCHRRRTAGGRGQRRNGPILLVLRQPESPTRARLAAARSRRDPARHGLRPGRARRRPRLPQPPRLLV